MDLRLATTRDLTKIKEMYLRLIRKMKENGIDIWDDSYPCEFFADDIAGNNLYVLSNRGRIVGAFALCGSHAGESHVTWKTGSAKAIYLDRLGVDADSLKQGIGTALLNEAVKIAKEKSAETLRLFAVDKNTPAINLYQKFGFIKAKGIYTEIIEQALSFQEYGFEKEL